MRAFLRNLVPALVLLGSVTAIAQPEKAAAPTAKQLSAADMKTRAEALGTQMDADFKHVTMLKELTKKKKDVIKLNCVNDKLVELKAQMKIADNARAGLASANNEAAMATDFASLETAAQGSRELREEANGCIGEPELFKQEAGVDVTRPDMLDDPGSIDPYGGDDGVEVEPPGYASAFH